MYIYEWVAMEYSEIIKILFQYVFGSGGFAVAVLMWWNNKRSSERKEEEVRRDRYRLEEKHRLEIAQMKQDLEQRQDEKKSDELKYLRDQLEALRDLYKENQRANEEAMKRKDFEIQTIKEELERFKELHKKVVKEKEEAEVKADILSKGYTRHIAEICKNHSCKLRECADVEDITEDIKKLNAIQDD